MPLRIFHWLLVIFISAACVTGKLGSIWLDMHSHFGAITISLVVFRCVWGMVGSTYARFSSFKISFSNIKLFLTSRWTGVGHSPIGAISIYSLLFLILTQAIFGLFSMNDEIDFYGQFYNLVSTSWNQRFTGWHIMTFNILLGLIILHVLAIAYYLLFRGENLVTPMITGKVKLTDKATHPAAKGGGALSLFLSVFVAGIIFSIIESRSLHALLFQIPTDASFSSGNPIW